MFNITREDLLEAINIVDDSPELRNGRESTSYDLVYNGKKYPPVLIISEANKRLGGKELTLQDFGNSANKAFEILKEHGFNIVNKFSFYKQLNKFISQAHTNTLHTLEYHKIYNGLKVKVSFGQGSPARVPWIAFLKDNQTVQKGIYPVYLFYKDKQILILAYGVSETNKPINNWNIQDNKSIESYFIDKNLGKPERYGSSFVYKAYDTQAQLNPVEIDKDLNELIAIYRGSHFSNLDPLANEESIDSIEKNEIESLIDYNSFFYSAYEAGIKLNKSLCLRFIAALITKPFVILTGLSGSGKTKLAQSFAMWICENENQYSILPVGADWTNREPLLGFPNALKENEYVKPENKVLELIIDANNNLDKPYFLILDEMNLSHVERYFADFLSVMETKTKIKLHSGDQEWNGVPAEISFPSNLFIIGTVNIDETTYMFSPKVLDRANVIEFRVTDLEMENYLQNKSNVNLSDIEGIGVEMANSFVQIAIDDTLEISNSEELIKSLLFFFSELKKTGAEFGYRTASEILRFVAVVNKIENDWDVFEIIDAAIMQKLLPKVHGSRRKLEPILKTLGGFCLIDGEKIEEYLNPSVEIKYEKNAKIKYPLSLEKILRMYNNLISNGFTSYAEA